MRRIATMFLTAAALVLFVSDAQSQAPQRDLPPRGSQPGQPPRGGFVPPPLPLQVVLDANGDGEISAEELKNASAALKKLDKNKDGILTREELVPQFGGGGRGFPGGGRGFPGGGRGIPGGGRGGFSPFGGGDASAETLPPSKIEFRDGAAEIPDHETFQRLSYKGDEVLIDTFLAGIEFVKFTLDKATSSKPQLYFINTNTHRAHMMFGRAAGLPFRGGDQMKGVLVYRPMLKSPSGKAGLFTFEFEPFDAYSHDMVKTCYTALLSKMPILKGNIGYYPRGERAIARVGEDKAKYKRSGIPVYQDEDLNNTEVAFLPLNPGKSFGRLRLMEIDERPSPRDIVLYKSLPNEMPRVAGIITAVRQTPLSHVNLRAIQDRIPNAFISKAAELEAVRPLIGKFVFYQVTAEGYKIREATSDEVDAHFVDLRPSKKQVPKQDLSVTRIRPLGDVKFSDASNVGVKAANLATMRTFGFVDGTVPSGFAVPFYFYDEFMKHNGFDQYAAELLAKPEFKQNRDAQELQLEAFRALIVAGKIPSWMMSALDELQKSFPQGSSIRCRSSTNNEDLPGFSGAGLYDSFTHHPLEGHLSKSIKQVYASLWNFRAFEERDFYRVDHFATAMGVLVHANFKGELANGVAVTDDILYQTKGHYYLNTQVGEDLVTNPNEASIPEEILLDWWNIRDNQLIRNSNRSADSKSLLSPSHLEQLRDYLATVHAKFAKLYGTSLEDENFSMEIEFKITKQGKLVIKQARPWVYAKPDPSQPTDEVGRGRF
jgi:hypothetical protein